jgi:hypothetical protein
MTAEEIYAFWAPAGHPWSPWAKPVLFASLDAGAPAAASAVAVPPWFESELWGPLRAPASIGERHAAGPYRDTTSSTPDAVLIADLPGADGVRFGAACAARGIRPVPLYNAMPGPDAVVRLDHIMAALIAHASAVAGVPAGAPPVFLLDAHRMRAGRPVGPGAFDNRSMCLPLDFPSVETLARAGIRRVVLILDGADAPSPDLEPILLGWQRAGLVLWRKRVDRRTPAAPIVLRRRWWLARLAAWIRHLGLRRRADGAFGVFVPSEAGG